MIYPIDSFKTEYDIFMVTFVRVASGIGWYGTFQGSEKRWGDFTFVDKEMKGDDPELREMFEILADQASVTLIKVYGDSSVHTNVETLSKHLRDFIKEKAS